METFKIKFGTVQTVLALGPESAGNFCLYAGGVLYFSEDFGDLLEDNNFHKFRLAVLNFLKKNAIKPDVILTDLHPSYKTTVLGQELSKVFKAKHVRIQHHIAHIFSATGEKMLETKNYVLKDFMGIACDGTGYGLDEKIWGGEIFKIRCQNAKVKDIKRIGHLENHILLGGDLAIREPARMLFSILSKFLDRKTVYSYLKNYYSKSEFGVLYSQLEQRFNCQETSSTGRILDAVSVLLGFAGNVRKYKHEPIERLEKNSTEPYSIRPTIIFNKSTRQYILQTTSLFKYLVKNIKKDKKRLAATAQLYIACGLFKIAQKNGAKKIYFSVGVANNKIISSYLASQGFYANKKIPRGDAGISFGQIFYYLLADPRD